MANDQQPIDIGDEIPAMEWTPDAEFVKAMMGLSGWLTSAGEANTNQMMARPNRFTDAAAAQSEGFRNMIVPGNLGMMAMATAVQRWLPDASFRKLDCVFRQPLNQGETVTAGGVVTDRHDEADHAVLELDVYLVRGDGQRPQGGTAVIIVPLTR